MTRKTLPPGFLDSHFSDQDYCCRPFSVGSDQGSTGPERWCDPTEGVTRRQRVETKFNMFRTITVSGIFNKSSFLEVGFDLGGD